MADTKQGDGGQAFPRAGYDGPDNRADPVDGMSLRDYFAAHAPKRPQAWFKPSILPKPKAIWPCSNTATHAEGCHCICYDVSPDNWKERDDYDVMYDAERLKQWPYAWADAMLKARG